MLKYAILCGLLLACTFASEVEPETEVEVEDPARIFATITTSYVTAVLSSGVSTFTTSCASVVNSTVPCRRRRGFFEKPILLSLDDDDIVPSAPEPVEASAAPALIREARSITPDIISSTNEDGLVELHVTGLKSCGEQRNFGIAALNQFQVTIQVTATTTVTYSSTFTTYKTYIVSGCSPSGIVTCTK